MGAINEFLAEVNREIDKTLDDLVPPPGTEPVRLHEAICWSLFAGGKRIRPAILIAVGRALGAATDKLLRTAAAVEMIHTYSLIHDDLPSMDDDDLRRGKATCHKQFGEATAILAGDALQTLAFKAIADDDGLPAATRIRLISTLAAASGTPDGMISGQQLDLIAEGQVVSISQIEQIHRQKTGALITAAARAGAMIAGASPEQLDAVAAYAEKLGLLFQITDDLLDVTQPTATLGKTAGKDASAEKATYPGHYGVERTRAMTRSIRDDACSELMSIGGETGLLHELTDLILKRTR